MMKEIMLKINGANYVAHLLYSYQYIKPIILYVPESEFDNVSLQSIYLVL